ncbi:MAG: cardiolipin synthase [Planctomycetota bacterium]|nr:MAG: cardiolipin synthase [Planctomycetota bacterium]
MIADLRLIELVPYLGIPLALHVIGITVAIDAVLHGRSSQAAIAWLLGLAFMPYLFLPAYLLIGFRRLDGYTDARRAGDAAIHHLGDGLLQQLEGVTWIDREHGEPEQTLTRLARLPLMRGNSCDLLLNGEATFESMFSGIANAQQTVLVQFYTVRDDGIGRRLHDALCRCADRGVRVYLLLDRVGSYGLSRKYVRSLRRAGVEVAWFTTGRGWWLHRFRVNFRNHRKIVVVDGKRAWIGGHNIGDEYVGKKRRLSPWRDTHLALAGPIALAAQLVFVEDWHWATDDVLALDWVPRLQPANQSLLLLPTGPADTNQAAQLALVQAIMAAQKRLWVSTPYFVPDEAVQAALVLAAARGVDVRLLVPASADHYVVHWAGESYLGEMAAAGVRVGEYQKGFIHQKLWMVDDHVASVGSLNWDNRAIHLNFEISVILPEVGQVEELAACFEQDWQGVSERSAAYFQKMSWLRRLRNRLCRLASPLL